MWLVGAARRIADTRTFTRIYTEIAVPVVLEQRQRQVPHSAVTARVALSREFVSFLKNTCRLPRHPSYPYSARASCCWCWNFGSACRRWAYLRCFMAFATFCRHQRKPVFPPEQQLGTRQPLRRAAAVPPLRTGFAPACADFQPRSLRLSLRRRGDGYFVRLCFCDDDAQRLRQRGAYLFGRHLSVDVCHEFGRCAAIGRTIFQFERHRTTDRVVGTEHQSRNLKNAV